MISDEAQETKFELITVKEVTKYNISVKIYYLNLFQISTYLHDI
jgi:hypothetical protein